MEIYREWLEETRPAPGPDDLRRPKWLKRPIGPEDTPSADDAWYVDGPVGRPERWDVETQSAATEDTDASSSTADDD